MPRGIPNIGNYDPQPEVLGIVKPEVTEPGPQAPKAWIGNEISMQEPPPPWELDSQSALTDSDARRFVTVPENWELRWINPRALNQQGWRDWQPVMASDPRVTVKVGTMVDVGNNIRKGNQGDILAWMYKSWVESRRRQHAEKTSQLTQSAIDRQKQLEEEFKGGKYGSIRLDSAKHPTHTMGDGRSMTD